MRQLKLLKLGSEYLLLPSYQQELYPEIREPVKDHTENSLLRLHLVLPLGEKIPEDPRKTLLPSEPSEDQSRTKITCPPGRKVIGLKPHPLLMAPAGPYSPVHIPYVFDNVKVDPLGAVLVFVGFSPDTHSTYKIPSSFPLVRTQKLQTQHHMSVPLRINTAWLSHF
jgi:hypothetical protein